MELNPINLNGLFQLAGNSASGFKLPEVSNAPSEAARALLQSNTTLAQQDMSNRGEFARQLLANKGALDTYKQAGANALALGKQSNLFEGGQSDLNRAITLKQQQLDNAYRTGELSNSQYQAQTARAQALSQIAGETQQQQIIAQQAPIQTQLLQDQKLHADIANTMAMQDHKIKNMGAVSSALTTQLYYSQGNPEAQQIAIRNAKIVTKELGGDPNSIPDDPNQAMSIGQYYTHLAASATAAKNAGGTGVNGMIIAPGPGGTMQAHLPLDKDQLAKTTDRLDSAKQQQDLTGQLLNSYMQHGHEWDVGSNRILAPLVGRAESISGMGDGPGSYADLEQQKQQWMAQAQKSNVDFLSSMPGFKYTNRSAGLVNDIAIKASDSPGQKIAKLQARQQLQGVQTDALADRALKGTDIGTISNNVNPKIEQVANQYYSQFPPQGQ